ncbi:MAG: phosphate acyltransferase PlsX [Rhodospirillales bacterium]|nr:phosphate acyltransferase PlsX [Rhodospirillales bacterium]MCB9973526.1 phosphate acyltransferase PlsX [Rhodospirillales bacterium]MCB9980678.1 phosphate acyltransferase PlsX [Rhodospirillales bacterium]
MTLSLAIDAMGGDHGVSASVAGAALCLKQHPECRFIFFGHQDEIEKAMAHHASLRGVSEIVHTDQVISGHEKPSVALRQAKNSSMRLAIDAVATGRAQAVVSSGNTGALMAISKMILKTLPQIRRPAIASVLPTMRGEVIMLDLGANSSCDSENLVQFAILGAVFARVIKGIANPTIGLLNVGSEDMKGTDQVKLTGEILRTHTIPGTYYGNVEGNDIPRGTTDVVVTDGFTGNVALKVAEGTSELITHFLKQSVKSSPLAMLGMLLASGAMKNLKRRADPRFYNGGMFLGLNGICVKSHGGSDSYGFSRALLLACDLVGNDYNRKVARELESLMDDDVSQVTDI